MYQQLKILIDLYGLTPFPEPVSYGRFIERAKKDGLLTADEYSTLSLSIARCPVELRHWTEINIVSLAPNKIRPDCLTFRADYSNLD